MAPLPAAAAEGSSPSLGVVVAKPRAEAAPPAAGRRRRSTEVAGPTHRAAAGTAPAAWEAGNAAAGRINLTRARRLAIFAKIRVEEFDSSRIYRLAMMPLSALSLGRRAFVLLLLSLSVGATASDDGHDAGTGGCDADGAVGEGVGGWSAALLRDWLLRTAGRIGEDAAVAEFAGITGDDILEFTESELTEVREDRAVALDLHGRTRPGTIGVLFTVSLLTWDRSRACPQIAGLGKAKAKLLHKRLLAPVIMPGYATNPPTLPPTSTPAAIDEATATAAGKPRRAVTHVPFVPLPSAPILKPWTMGIETGRKLSNAGNTMVADGNVRLDVVPRLSTLLGTCLLHPA